MNPAHLIGWLGGGAGLSAILVAFFWQVVIPAVKERREARKINGAPPVPPLHEPPVEYTTYTKSNMDALADTRNELVKDIERVRAEAAEDRKRFAIEMVAVRKSIEDKDDRIEELTRQVRALRIGVINLGGNPDALLADHVTTTTTNTNATATTTTVTSEIPGTVTTTVQQLPSDQGELNA